MLKIVNQNDLSGFSGSCSHLFVSPEWLKVITDTYGFEFYALVSEDKNFVLPYCLTNNRFYPSVKSIPFGDYTLLYCPETLANEALNLLKGRFPGHYIETSVVGNGLPEINGYTGNQYGFLTRIDIEKWRKSRTRNGTYERNIKNALHYGITVKVNRDFSGLKGFYRLHEQLRINKFGKLPQPFRFFFNIHKVFFEKGKGFLLEAWSKNRLIASWVILQHGQTLYYKFGASDRNSLHHRPNDLLFRTLMQYGSDHGFETIDLGFSGASKSYEGLIRFKSKEGGVKAPIYRIEFYPAGFDYSLVKRRTEYNHKITRDALNTRSVMKIREASNKYYVRFA